MEKYKAFITPIDNAIAALERFYELGDMEGFTNQEMSRISSCLNKVRKAKSDFETAKNAPLVDVINQVCIANNGYCVYQNEIITCTRPDTECPKRQTCL
jgi:hypothetical protein